MPIRVEDIAHAAGVSRTTVLRALWDRPGIRPGTKEKVKRIALEMKYRPNHIARSLVMGRSPFVGLMISPYVLPGFQPIVEYVIDCLDHAGYTMLLRMCGTDADAERTCIERLLRNRVAGVVAIPAAESVEYEAYQELLDNGVKLVVIDRYIEGLQAPQVTSDNYRSAHLATEHLISLGHRDIVHLQIPEVSHIGRERARGFREAMQAAELAVTDESSVETGFDERSGTEAMWGLLGRARRPTAIVARNDLVAKGAMQAVYSAGLSVPEDVSIVGNGDIPESKTLRSPLTTVRHSSREVIDAAVNNLLCMLEGASMSSEATVLGVELVVRSSTARRI